MDTQGGTMQKVFYKNFHNQRTDVKYEVLKYMIKI